MALYFDLNGYSKSTDNALLERVDRRVARYYLAVPLAGEDNRVTVATAYPDNAAALRVLERLLRADVVPVSSAEGDLRAVIDRLYPVAAPAQGNILAWADDPAWEAAVAATAQAHGEAAGCGVDILPSATPLEEVLAAAWSTNARLLVAHAGDDETLAWLVHRSPASLLVVRGEFTGIDQVLVALRGYGSDLETLDRIRPLLAHEDAGATVLPLSRSATSRLNDLLAEDSPAKQHLQAFLSEPNRQSVRVEIRLSQGDAITQIVGELAQGGYGMLVIAAEAEGRFVWQVLSRIEREGVWPGRPVLVVKPPVRLE
jgi:hypothetical protein